MCDVVVEMDRLCSNLLDIKIRIDEEVYIFNKSITFLVFSSFSGYLPANVSLSFSFLLWWSLRLYFKNGGLFAY